MRPAVISSGIKYVDILTQHMLAIAGGRAKCFALDIQHHERAPPCKAVRNDEICRLAAAGLGVEGTMFEAVKLVIVPSGAADQDGVLLHHQTGRFVVEMRASFICLRSAH